MVRLPQFEIGAGSTLSPFPAHFGFYVNNQRALLNSVFPIITNKGEGSNFKNREIKKGLLCFSKQPLGRETIVSVVNFADHAPHRLHTFLAHPTKALSPAQDLHFRRFPQPDTLFHGAPPVWIFKNYFFSVAFLIVSAIRHA